MLKRSVFLLLFSMSFALLECRNLTKSSSENNNIVLYADEAQLAVSTLNDIAQRYTDFLAQFGKKDTGDLIGQMESLIAPDCHKIVNGKIVSTTLLELHNQIAEAKTSVGLWEVNVESPFIVSSENNTVVVHYEIPTTRQGTLAVMKFLKCNSNGLIIEINEVFNKKD